MKQRMGWNTSLAKHLRNSVCPTSNRKQHTETPRTWGYRTPPPISRTQCLGINNKIVYFHRQGKQVFLFFTKISTFKFVWIFFSPRPQRFSPGVPGAALWGTTSRHHQAQQCSLAEQPALTHTQLGSGFCATSSRQILPGNSSRRDRNEFETAVGLHALGWN